MLHYIRLCLTYLLGSLSFFLIFCSRPFVLFKLVRIDTINYGRFFDNFSIYINQREFFDKETKKIKHVLWFSNKEISNDYIKKKYLNRFKVYEYNFLLYSVDKVLRLFNDNKNLLDIMSIFEIEKKFYIPKNCNNLGWSFKNYFDFEKEEEKKGLEILEKFNLKKDSKWICIHNRDRDFKKKINSENVEKSHLHRNFNISLLRKAANIFADNGYYVFRIGSHQSEKINFSSDKIFDYPFSDNYSSFGNIFLMKHCQAYFGSNSGASTPAVSFKRPIAYVNFAPLHLNLSTFFKTLPSIFKRLKSLDSNKFLTLKEMFAKNLMGKSNFNEIQEKGYVHIDNSEDDISDLALEILSCLNGNLIYTKNESQLMETYNEIFDKHAKNLYGGPRSQLLIGKEFLKKNVDLLN